MVLLVVLDLLVDQVQKVLLEYPVVGVTPVLLVNLVLVVQQVIKVFLV